ncbi:MAG: hypothetical protein AB1481_07675 [Candidatus Omnitrophota bacterium]
MRADDRLAILRFSIAFFIFFIIYPPFSISETSSPWQEQKDIIDDIWQGEVSKYGREKAADKILRIAVDNKQDIHLREFAVGKLRGERMVKFAADMRGISDKIRWEDDKQRQLKSEALLAYHVLRYHGENSPEAKRGLLLESLQNPSARDWAIDELIFLKDKDSLALIKESVNQGLSGEDALVEIALIEEKFEIITASNNIELLRLAVREKYPLPDKLFQDRIVSIRSLLSDWAKEALSRFE